MATRPIPRTPRPAPDVKTATKPTPKSSGPKRSITLIRNPNQYVDGIGVLRITIGKTAMFYLFREIPCEIGGRGFVMHRLGLGEVYHVRIGGASNCSCECMGWCAHDACKHVQGLKALIRSHQV